MSKLIDFVKNYLSMNFNFIKKNRILTIGTEESMVIKTQTTI